MGIEKFQEAMGIVIEAVSEEDAREPTQRPLQSTLAPSIVSVCGSDERGSDERLEALATRVEGDAGDGPLSAIALALKADKPEQRVPVSLDAENPRLLATYAPDGVYVKTHGLPPKSQGPHHQKKRPEELLPPNEKGPQHGGGRRTDIAELQLRLRVVEGLMLRGFMGREVQESLRTIYHKDIPWPTVAKYIRHVAKLWEEEDALARPYRRQRQLRQLYMAADDMLQHDPPMYREWLETQRLIARIEGNEAPQRIELDRADRFDGWSVEELEHYANTGETPARLGGHTGTTQETRALPEHTDADKRQQDTGGFKRAGKRKHRIPVGGDGQGSIH